MVIKQETIDVRYCDFCDAKQTDDENWVTTCQGCGKDACAKHCHRMVISHMSPTLSSNAERQFKFGAMLCKECVEVETKELKDFLCSRGFKEF